MQINRDSPPAGRNIEAQAKETPKSLVFLKKLNLDEGTIERLAKISFLAEAKLQNQLESLKKTANDTLAPEIKEARVPSEEDLEAKRIALASMGLHIANLTLEGGPPYSPSPLKERQDFTFEAYKELLGEFNEFRKDIKLLVGDDPKLDSLMTELHKNYQVLWNASPEIEDDSVKGEKAYQVAQQNIDKLHQEISKRIATLAAQPFADREVVAAGIIASLVTSAKREALLNGAGNTHRTIVEIKNAVMQQLSKETTVTTPEDRKALYRHLKVIQERTQDLMDIDRASKRSFSFLPFIRRGQSAELKREYAELRSVADQYYAQFNFKEDEVEEFREFSIEAHMPKRQHLMMYVQDIVVGAQNEGLRLLDRERGRLIQEYLKENHPAQKEFLEGELGQKCLARLDERIKLEEEIRRLDGLGMGTSNASLSLQKKQQLLDAQIIDEHLKLDPEQIRVLDRYAKIKASGNGEFKKMQEDIVIQEYVKIKHPQEESVIQEYLKAKHPNDRRFIETERARGILEMRSRLVDLQVEIKTLEEKLAKMDESHPDFHKNQALLIELKKSLTKVFINIEKGKLQLKPSEEAVVNSYTQIKASLRGLSEVEGEKIPPLATLLEKQEASGVEKPLQKLLVIMQEVLSEEKNPSRLNEKLQRFNKNNEALAAYMSQVAGVHQKAAEHKDIGNNNVSESLSLDKKTYKEQQKLAKAAIQGLFDDLKKAYVDSRKEIDGPTDEKVDAKKAAQVLTLARNAVLADDARWDRPIVREIQFSRGPLPSHANKRQISITHAMSCPNEGYPSSANRGREAGPGITQPNLHRVRLTDADGRSLGEYTSSATNVEFFLDGNNDDSEKRTQATRHQTMEILMGKVDRKWEKMAPEERAGVGTPDNPLVIDVPVTLLLSPDTLRDWLMKNKEFQERVVKIAGPSMEVDPSKLERRILKESEAAWNSFDRSSAMGRELPTFTFKDQAGNTRIITAHYDETKGTYFTMSVKDEAGKTQQIHVQFDIACYNVGCNKWTKLMTDFKYGLSIEQLANYGIPLAKYAQKTLSAVGIHYFGKQEITKYSGKAGNLKEDKMNQKAFAKDTQKYTQKVKVMEGRRGELLGELYGTSESFYQEATKEGIKKYQDEIRGLQEQIDNKRNSIATLEIPGAANNTTTASEIKEQRQSISKDELRIKQLEASIRKLRLEDLEAEYTDKSGQVGLEDPTVKEMKSRIDDLKKHQKVDQLIYGGKEGPAGKGIRQLREEFLEAERAVHHSSKSTAKKFEKVRDQAFRELQAKKDELATLLDLELNVNGDALSKEMKEVLEGIRNEEDLRDVYEEVHDLFEFRDHRNPHYMKQNMYLLPSRLVVLGMLLEQDPHTGCRSGKDRTSIQRMEVGTLLMLRNAYGRHLNYREQERYPLTSEIREQMLLNSGHIDNLAFLNIGSHGLNLSGSYGAYLKNFSREGTVVNHSWYQQVLEQGKSVFSMTLK